MKSILLVVLVLGFLSVGVCVVAGPAEASQQPAAPPVGRDHQLEERNKALAGRFYEQVWFSRNLSAVDDLVASTYVIHDIGELKRVTEVADQQKQIADFFWQNGSMKGEIDYQIAEGDLVATRWQWDFQPRTWWLRSLNVGARNPIPIINVFRFRDGKIVEIWNHRHDIDSGLGNLVFVKGFLLGLIPSLVLSAISFLLWRKLRKQRHGTETR